VVKEIEDKSPETQELLKKVLALFEEYLKINQKANLDSIIPALRENSTDRIADIISSHLYLPLQEKQNLLETLNTRERLNRLEFLLQESLVNFIGREPGAGPTRRRGGQKEAGQRTFIPGGQFKKEEQPNEIEDLKRKVTEAQMPPDAHEKAMKEIERMETMPPMSAEATVSRNYLDWLISLPWNKKSREKET